MSPPEETEKPFELSYDYVLNNYGDWEHRQITPPMPPLGIEVTKDSREKKPSEPVLLGGLGKIVYRARVELPPGYSMIAPSPVNLVKPYAEYHTTNVVEDGVLTTSRQFIIRKIRWQSAIGTISASLAGRSGMMSSLYTLGRGRGDCGWEGGERQRGGNGGRRQRQTFREGNQALQRRDGRQAQRLFEKVIAHEPKYKGAHFNLGIALVAQGNFSDALVEFRKEEEISPDEVRSYLAAATYANFTGQKDEAVAELRKLLKVDPDNRDAAMNLSQLLGVALASTRKQWWCWRARLRPRRTIPICNLRWDLHT